MISFYENGFLRTALLTLACSLPGMAQALPTCPSVLATLSYEDRFGPVLLDDTAPACSVHWVQNGRMLGLDWLPSENSDVLDLRNFPNGTQTLYASRPPHLVDIDQDGWLDVAVFSLIGMVNGNYDIFRYNPQTRYFEHIGWLNGAQFIREPGGYLVAVGRSSAAASNVAIFTIGAGGLTAEASLYVDAGLQAGPDGTAQCTVSANGQSSTNPNTSQLALMYPDAPELVARYCKLYEPGTQIGESLADVRVNPTIVPDDTVFYCQLQGTNKAVTVTRDATGYTYSYGPTEGTPELSMVRSLEEVDILPDNGAGGNRFGHIEFRNDAFLYSVYYSYQLIDDTGTLRDIGETFRRALVVYKDADFANPVFHRVCDPDLAADSIAFLDRS